MLVVDYLILNEDRHLNNFGMLRNADTREFIGAAPIFDSGSSFGYSAHLQNIMSQKLKSKPFKNTHPEQLKLVTSFDWVDFEKLEKAADEIDRIFAVGDRIIGESRRKLVVKAFMKRVEDLFEFSKLKREIVDNYNDDLKKNIAEDYS